jgi:hypothetical protein
MNGIYGIPLVAGSLFTILQLFSGKVDDMKFALHVECMFCLLVLAVALHPSTAMRIVKQHPRYSKRTVSLTMSSSIAPVPADSTITRTSNSYAFIKGLQRIFHWPVFRVFKKAVNVWGVVFGIQCWSIMLLWMVGMLMFMPFKLIFGNRLDPDGILIDTLGRWWSFLVSFPHSLPRITGRQNLPPSGEACVFIANHASWMDIPMVGLLPPLKFVCKKELTKVYNACPDEFYHNFL